MAKDKQLEAMYKAEGLRRVILRRAKRKIARAIKKDRQERLRNWSSCCEYGADGQTECDWSC